MTNTFRRDQKTFSCSTSAHTQGVMSSFSAIATTVVVGVVTCCPAPMISNTLPASDGVSSSCALLSTITADSAFDFPFTRADVDDERR